MGNYKTVHFKVLPDNCSAEDQLEDRTHERIADKLYEIIAADGSEGMTIGLEGEWGSGKSTVVRLLRERLTTEKKSKSFVFYIDAWEHEGDHLRRVFLETLVEKVKEWREWGKDVVAKLDGIADRITSKKVSKKVEHTSQMTGFGKVVAFAALLVPLGASLLTVFAERVTTQWTGVICWEFWISFFLTMSPVWVYVWRWVLNLFCSKEKKFSLFETEANVDTTYETSREEERSSVEFERYFNEILQFVAFEIHKIIMVIDNLDRVNPEDALRIWSTLQAFVQSKNPISSKTNRPCKWIIVPYAQEGLRRIWNEGVGQVGTGNVNRPLSYMDKSFQLRLHVPKMVISGWKSFARKCLKEAAGELDGNDVKKILDVLSWTRKNLTDAPSPRQIKVYVNQVGLACSLHGERVPLEAICFYVVKKYLCGLTDAELEKELREGGISKTSLPQYENNERLASEVAAILYGVEEKNAMQILLEPDITTALLTSNSELLVQMREIHGKVFYDVLTYIIQHTKQEDMLKSYGSIQKAFVDVDTAACGYARNALRLHLDIALKQMDSLRHADAIAVIGLANADKNLTKELANAYVIDLPKRFRNDGGVSSRLDQKVEYIDSPAELVTRFTDVSSVAKEKITIPYKCFKDENVDLSKFSTEEIEQITRYMGDVDDAENDIVEHIRADNSVPQWIVTLFSSLIKIGMRRCEAIVNAVIEMFNDGRGEDVALWNLLLALERLPKQERPIQKIKDFMLTEAPWSVSDFPNDIAAFLVAKYCGDIADEELLPDGVGRNILNEFISHWNERNNEWGTSIYEHIALSHEFEWLTREALKSNRALVGCIVESALDAKDSYLFEVGQPFNFFANLLGLVDETRHQSLVECFVSNEVRLQKLSESDGEKFVDRPKACLKLLVAIRGKDVYTAVSHKIESELKELSQDEWSAALKTSNELAELIEYLVQNGERLDLANPYCEALKDFIAEGIKNVIDCSLSFETLESLHNAMKPVFQSVFAAGIGEALNDTKFVIETAGIKEFVLRIPDYKEWLAGASLSVKNIAAELSKVEHLTAFDSFIKIMQRCDAMLPNKAEIKDIIEQPVLTMLKSDDQNVRAVGNSAAMCFGIEDMVKENAEVQKGE